MNRSTAGKSEKVNVEPTPGMIGGAAPVEIVYIEKYL